MQVRASVSIVRKGLRVDSTRRSFLVAHTGGKPRLQIVDLDGARTVPLATPLDRDAGAVKHAHLRDGYVAIHAESSIGVSTDLQSGARRLGSGWFMVRAADPALVWRWEAPPSEDAPSTCVLVDGTGEARARYLLNGGYRLRGDTAVGPVVDAVAGIHSRDAARVGLWDVDAGTVVTERAGWFIGAHPQGSVLLSRENVLEVWDVTRDHVAAVDLPDGVESPQFPSFAPTSTLVAWPSGRYARGRPVRVVIADMATASVVAVVPVDVPYLGSLCWSHDARWLYASFREAPIVRCFSADGSEVNDVRFQRAVGNLECDLGPAVAPLTAKRIVVTFEGAESGRLPRTASEKMLHTATASALRDELGRFVTKRVMDLARPAVRLVADDVGRSQIGGPPRLPVGTEWPSHDGRPLSLLAQIDLADVRRAWRGSPYPSTGSLAFFYGPLDQDSFAEHAVVIHVEGHAVETEPPSQTPSFTAVPVRPELMITLPTDVDERIGDHNGSAAARNLFAELFGIAGGPWHQMGGHPGWIQGGQPGELVLQVDCDIEAGMEWGDGGRVFFLLDGAELATQNFLAVTAVEECG